MTTTAEVEVTCAVCGSVNTVEVLTSSNELGSAGLDFRPPPMIGDTVDLWVQECRECGFVAEHLAEAVDGLEALVLGEGYQQARRAWTGLDKARKFHLLGWLAEQRGAMNEAFFAYLNGAWCCDGRSGANTANNRRHMLLMGDVSVTELRASDHLEDAADFRRDAVRTLEAARANRTPFYEDAEIETLVTIDLNRRIGAFDQAAAVAERALAEDCHESTRDVAGFQQTLIAARDTGEYTITDMQTWVAAHEPGT